MAACRLAAPELGWPDEVDAVPVAEGERLDAARLVLGPVFDAGRFASEGTTAQVAAWLAPPLPSTYGRNETLPLLES